MRTEHVSSPDVSRRPGQVLGVHHSSGTVRHVREVARGEACECRCPDCGASLLARQGDVYDHHFAHADASDCPGGGEGALHRFAKQTVLASGRLRLPAANIVVATGPFRETASIAAVASFVFDRVLAEEDEAMPAFAGFRPDLLAVRGDVPLAVEILVTHAVDAVKAERIRVVGISALEIDLRDVPSAVLGDAAALRRFVLDGAPRRWIHNRRLEARRSALLEDLRARTAGYARDVTAHRRREALRLYDQVTGEGPAVARIADLLSRDRMLRAGFASYRPEVRQLRAREVCRRLGLDAVVEEPRDRPGWGLFGVPPAVWRAALLHDALWRGVLSPASTVRALSDHGVYPEPVAAALRSAVLVRAPDVEFPDRAVRRYLAHLVEAGLVAPSGEGFVTDAALRQRYMALVGHRRWLARLARRLKADVRLPPGFDVATWIAALEAAGRVAETYRSVRTGPAVEPGLQAAGLPLRS